MRARAGFKRNPYLRNIKEAKTRRGKNKKQRERSALLISSAIRAMSKLNYNNVILLALERFASLISQSAVQWMEPTALIHGLRWQTNSITTPGLFDCVSLSIHSVLSWKQEIFQWSDFTSFWSSSLSNRVLYLQLGRQRAFVCSRTFIFEYNNVTKCLAVHSEKEKCCFKVETKAEAKIKSNWSGKLSDAQTVPQIINNIIT